VQQLTSTFTVRPAWWRLGGCWDTQSTTGQGQEP